MTEYPQLSPSPTCKPQYVPLPIFCEIKLFFYAQFSH